MSKKGQSTMELLMTYGWAVLVVLVAIGALLYFYNQGTLGLGNVPITENINCERANSTTIYFQFEKRNIDMNGVDVCNFVLDKSLNLNSD